MGAGPSNYPRGTPRGQDKTADRRARGLPGLYRGKLAAIDRQYYGTVEGEVTVGWPPFGPRTFYT